MRINALVVERTDAPFTWQQLDVDEPGPGEVIVRVAGSGLCHTDLNTQAGNMPFELPGVLGHEGSGVVERVGPGVDNVRPGDHVIIGWPFCGQCRNCVAGEHRYCLHIGELLCGGHRFSGPHAKTSAYSRRDGSPVGGHFFGQSSFADYSLTSASQLVAVDKSLPLELLGALGCGIATGAGAVLNTARPEPGDSVVVYGAGAVGLAAVMAARNTPATTVVAVDLHDSRLDLARQFGATHVINPGSEGALERIREITGGAADHVIECTGVIAVLEEAIEATGMLGTCIMVGGAPADARFSADHLRTLWGKRIVGTLGGSGSSQQLIPALIHLWQQGRFPFDRLITTYPMREIDTAVKETAEGAVVKAVLTMA